MKNAKLLKKPDAAKGERAVYALMVEGSDNDGDGKFNEDGIGGSGGGIDLDMNFPYRWPEYADGAGAYQLCEPESLALVDWMLKQKSIAAVMVYGSVKVSSLLSGTVLGDGTPLSDVTTS